MKEIFRFEAGESENNSRLDKFIFSRVGFLSRMFLATQIAEGFCQVNGEQKPSGYKIKQDDVVEIELDVSAQTSMKPEKIPLEIQHEDEEILVVVKPAGMLVHPSRYIRSGTLLNALAFHVNQNSDLSNGEENLVNSSIIRVGLPHRLDKETSGLMLISKTDRALRILSSHFQRKLIEKTYLAVVEGIVSADSGEIHAPVGRLDDGIPRWRVLPDGKPAETHFQVIERRTDSTLLELQPITGRTNQLRVHCAHVGHPILGDVNRKGRVFSRLCLHAYKLGFFHPNGGWLEFISELPQEMK